MTNTRPKPISERPIRSSEEDLLDRNTFVRRIGQALITPDGKRSTGVVIGICGEWGSGKSSVLALLGEHLEKDRKALVVTFDPWLISGRDDLVGRLLTELAGEIVLRSGGKGAIAQKAKKAVKPILDYLWVLSPMIDLAATTATGLPVRGAGAVAANAARKAGEKLASSPSLEARKQVLSEKLESLGMPIIVLIDELDRLEDAEVRAVAQLVRAVADFPQISYVLAYDPARVIEALGADAGPRKNDQVARGRSYLEKIVQHQIPLPVAFDDELTALAGALIASIKNDLNLPDGWEAHERYRELIRILIPGMFRTPRDIKRWVGLSHVQGAMFIGEVDWVDILGWSALMTKAPQTVNNVRRDPSRFCYGLTPRDFEEELESYIETERDPQKRLEAVCAPVERSRSLEKLIQFLFPALTGEYPSGHQPDRIFNARPLLTLLRYGLPPGHYSRKDIETILERGGNALAQFLEEAITKDDFQAFLRRLYEVYPYVENIDHFDLWQGIATFLQKPDNAWHTRFTPFHHLCNTMVEMLDARITVDPAFASVARTLVERLANADEWELRSAILWNHVWGHGLFKARRRERQPTCLTAEETETLASAFARQAVERFLENPRFVATLWNFIPFYLAMWTDAWDDNARQRMNELLADPGAIDTLVLHMFGGQYTTSKETIEKLISADSFFAAVKKRADTGMDNIDPTLRAAYDKVIQERGIPAT